MLDTYIMMIFDFLDFLFKVEILLFLIFDCSNSDRSNSCLFVNVDWDSRELTESIDDGSDDAWVGNSNVYMICHGIKIVAVKENWLSNYNSC